MHAKLIEMAQAIYREWFVNFRFPGHEKVRMVDSPLGRVPEGWGVVPVTETFEDIAGPVGSQLLNLQRKNQNLRQTRDLLLSKLISGEVEVSELVV